MADNSTDRKVKPRDPKVEIEYTEASKFHKKGDTSIVHEEMANKLIAKGFAVKKGQPHPEAKKVKVESGNVMGTNNTIKSGNQGTGNDEDDLPI